MPKRGADFERLVGWITASLEPGARVELDRRVRDKDTGKKRQIDVLIHRTSAKGEVRAIVECRDHRRPVGVEYLEQVAQKRISVEAQRAAVVSKSGFHASARLKARALDIDLYSYDEALATNWSAWLTTRVMTMVHYSWSPRRVFCFAAGSAQAIVPHATVIEAAARDPAEKVLTDAVGTPVFSLMNAATSLMSVLGDMAFVGLTPGETATRMLPAIAIGESQDLGIADAQGTRRRIAYIAVEAELSMESHERPFDMRHYTGPDGAVLAEVCAANLAASGSAFGSVDLMGVHHDGDPPGTKRVHLRFSEPEPQRAVPHSRHGTSSKAREDGAVASWDGDMIGRSTDVAPGQPAESMADDR